LREKIFIMPKNYIFLKSSKKIILERSPLTSSYFITLQSFNLIAQIYNRTLGALDSILLIKKYKMQITLLSVMTKVSTAS